MCTLYYILTQVFLIDIKNIIVRKKYPRTWFTIQLFYKIYFNLNFMICCGKIYFNTGV